MPVNIGILNSTTGFGGLCLKFTRLAFGVPALYATAYKAWLGAQHKHPGDANPPYGVAVFWAPHDPGGAGHVAPSLGGGLVRTTNSATQTIYTVAISKITSAWGMPYLGWTEDLNGVRIWTPTAPAQPVPVPAPPAQEDDMTDYLVHHTNGSAQAMYLVSGPSVYLLTPSPTYPDLVFHQARGLRTVEVTGPVGMDPIRRAAEAYAGALPAATAGSAGGVGISLAQVEAAVKATLTTLTLKSV